jgi:hypothetical protein
VRLCSGKWRADFRCERFAVRGLTEASFYAWRRTTRERDREGTPAEPPRQKRTDAKVLSAHARWTKRPFTNARR